MPIEVNIPALEGLLELGNNNVVAQVAGDACLLYLQEWMDNLDATKPNKLGGDRTHFWKNLGGELKLTVIPGTAEIDIPSPFLYLWQGGTIYAKDKLLSVPARAEAHGHSARDFGDLLHFGMFRSTGTKFLADKDGGIFYWLCPSVTYGGDPSVMPSDEQITDVAVNAIGNWWITRLEMDSGFN